MNITELFNLGNKFASEGKGNQALDMWHECLSIDPMYGPAYLNIHNAYKQMGNLQKAKDCLDKFLNCPVTGNTLDIIPKIKQEIEELNKKLVPPPVEKK